MTVDSFVVLPISQRTGSLARVCGQGRSATREGGEVDRKALLREAVKKAGLVAGGWGVAAAGLPQLVGAKKIINLEEARELGEKKMIEIEKAKGPLIKVRGRGGEVGMWSVWRNYCSNDSIAWYCCCSDVSVYSSCVSSPNNTLNKGTRQRKVPRRACRQRAYI